MWWIRSGIEILSKSKVIGRCGPDEKKRMTTQNRQKSNTKKKFQKNYSITMLFPDFSFIYC